MKVTVKSGSDCFGDGNFFPPGFRFHPTDEELVLYYLKKKICKKKHRLDVIVEIDVYKWEPEELPGLSKLKTGDKQWFFFSPRDRKPNGARSNRGTRHGYWKATGKDRVITCNSRAVGAKKTLVFYNGRAPKGERTDWVMHEYTMDEEELQRCQDARDCYALYKVFKKSGPGPKNGEQYGAPFREEDWVDDDDDSGNQVNETVSTDQTRVNFQLQSPLHDLEKLLNSHVDDEPVIGNETASFANNRVDFQLQSSLHGLEELLNCDDDEPLVNGLKATLPEQSTLQLQEYEAPESTLAVNGHREGLHVGEKDFLEDFIELDDLVGEEPTSQTLHKAIDVTEELKFDEFDGLSELDFYQDASMFLQEPKWGQISQLYANNVENGFVDQISNYCLNNNPVSTNLTDQLHEPFSNETNCHQLPATDANHGDGFISSPTSAHLGQMAGMGKTMSSSTRQELSCPSGMGEFEPSLKSSSSLSNDNDIMLRMLFLCYQFFVSLLGMVQYGNYVNNFTEENQNQNRSGGGGDEGGESWFSCALWDFVESIPTSPASAAEESALVNRAFVRMSSFGRIQKSNVCAAGNSNSRNSMIAVLCFSLVGVSCAVLWVLTGTSVRVRG